MPRALRWFYGSGSYLCARYPCTPSPCRGRVCQIDEQSLPVFGRYPWKVDVRLLGKGNFNLHGARLVHEIISMIKRIRTSQELSLWQVSRICHPEPRVLDCLKTIIAQVLGPLTSRKGTPSIVEKTFALKIAQAKARIWP